METRPRRSRGMVLELSRVSSEDIGRVGGKAACQASLLQAGFPVPDGIVLTTDVYARVFPGQPADPSGPQGAEGSSPSPPELRHLLAEVVETLGDTPLAVRSSGVAEDLPDVSFAGQYETVLNVNGLDELEDAVRRCWASAASTHATSYRDAHGLRAASMAVLVQRMVDAEAAGVAFSANPVTGHRQEVVINAVQGLGDKLVSGEVSPDQWLVRGDEVRCEESANAAIDGEQAHAIAEMTRRVETHFNGPQDIEWAIAEDRLHLLQARPITALPEPPHRSHPCARRSAAGVLVLRRQPWQLPRSDRPVLGRAGAPMQHTLVRGVRVPIRGGRGSTDRRLAVSADGSAGRPAGPGASGLAHVAARPDRSAAEETYCPGRRSHPIGPARALHRSLV